MFRIDASSIDKSLPVPVGTQLHGLLSYALAHGGVPYGSKLQSVRRLAAELGIAPMTVSHVYQRLRDDGLIEMRQGLGAFAVRDPKKTSAANALPVNALRGDIEMLIGKAERLGVPTMALVSMINAQAQLQKPRVGLRIVFVAIFEGPGREYLAQIKPALGARDQAQVLTIDALETSPDARQICLDADVVLTFVHRQREVAALIPDARILTLRFIPSEQTRHSLAGLDPRMRVAAITYFKEYIAIMRPSVREFAPHIADIKVTWSSAPDVASVIAQCDAVIYATGADHIAELVEPGKPCFEYRHAPDPGSLESVLVPYLAELRRDKIAEKGAAQGGPRLVETKDAGHS